MASKKSPWIWPLVEDDMFRQHTCQAIEEMYDIPVKQLIRHAEDEGLEVKESDTFADVCGRLRAYYLERKLSDEPLTIEKFQANDCGLLGSQYRSHDFRTLMDNTHRSQTFAPRSGSPRRVCEEAKWFHQEIQVPRRTYY